MGRRDGGSHERECWEKVEKDTDTREQVTFFFFFYFLVLFLINGLHIFSSEFINLVQGTMWVAEYETKFDELPKYGLHLIAIKQDKVSKFQRGLTTKFATELLHWRFADVLRSALLVEEGFNKEVRVQSQPQQNKTKKRPSNLQET